MSEQAFTDSEHRGRDASPASSRSRSPRPRSRSPARPSSSDNTNDESVNPGNNLFVNSLAAKTEASDLEDLFGKYGKVEKVQIMYDPHTRESRGFAFVTMVRTEDAEAAMQVLNGFELHGRTMAVKMAKRGRARTPTPGQYRGPPKRERAIGSMPYYPYDRRMGDRFDPRYDPRGPDPRDYRGGPIRGDYGRPAPYDRWMGGARPRYDDRPPRDYRPPYGMDRGYDDRSSMYDRGYERRPRYDERYDRY
ncbi:hypothetical protein BX616_004965 [Lobosporangium transversale]|uniref:RRM domain-containing protein n=1 Tax=Lobosporangium transversale TaxID=64571 RepID=A0A1Y2GI09_9FUNG|nr:hypothetical protein BCR41DRAFT_357693 [Lobosporangium transversale]KAF9915958.1 hypothetical protein BX616_004965 [Lobosporangium transversale]ORZ10284.1 hypothetical protein BCR41DRAFT_357693 [Lobosporangium transversale]|eukprot:XP_021879191.1 hypothetical protein BCR41DRAFT_357693 [Lobosporangium transversale]